MKLVLDTNCLIMAISSKSKYRMVWKAFLEDRFTLCVTNEILEEYTEVISRNINPVVADIVSSTILTRKNVVRLDPHFRFMLIEADPDDNKFVDCAIVAGAKYIVTEDRHFGVLKTIPFPMVQVASIDEFISKELMSYYS